MYHWADDYSLPVTFNLQNHWTHILVTHNSALQQDSFYVNGTNILTKSLKNPLAVSSQMFRIGTTFYAEQDKYVQGDLDEFAILNYAVSATQAGQLYARYANNIAVMRKDVDVFAMIANVNNTIAARSPFDAIAAYANLSLVAYWSFDSLHGAPFGADASSNAATIQVIADGVQGLSNTGTIMAPSSLAVDGSALPDSNADRNLIGSYARFKGDGTILGMDLSFTTTAFSRVPLPSGSHDFTVSFWFRQATNAPAANQGIFGYGAFYQATAQTTAMRLLASPVGQFNVYHWADDYSLPQTYSLQQHWTHIVLSYNSFTKMDSFYINGTLVYQKATGTLNVQSEYFRIGSTYRAPKYEDGYVQGDIDEFAILNYEISAAQVSTIYNRYVANLPRYIGNHWVMVYNYPPVFVRYSFEKSLLALTDPRYDATAISTASCTYSLGSVGYALAPSATSTFPSSSGCSPQVPPPSPLLFGAGSGSFSVGSWVEVPFTNSKLAIVSSGRNITNTSADASSTVDYQFSVTGLIGTPNQFNISATLRSNGTIVSYSTLVNSFTGAAMEWAHFGFSYNTSTAVLTIYVNGIVAQNWTGINLNLVDTTQQVMAIGLTSSTNGFLIDELVLTNATLQALFFANEYLAGAPIPAVTGVAASTPVQITNAYSQVSFTSVVTWTPIQLSPLAVSLGHSAIYLIYSVDPKTLSDVLLATTSYANYTITGLAPVSTTTLRVRAQDKVVQGKVSTAASTTVTALDLPPSIPAFDSSSPFYPTATANSITVLIAPVTSCGGQASDCSALTYGFQVRQSVNSSEANVTTAAFVPYSSSSQTVPIIGLSPYTTYLIRFRAQTAAGVSGWTQELSFNTLAAKPTIVAMPSYASSTDHSITATWSNSAAYYTTGGSPLTRMIFSYNDQTTGTSGSVSVNLALYSSTPTSYEITSLIGGHSYNVTWSLINGAGVATSSSSGTVVVLKSAPKLITATASDPNNLNTVITIGDRITLTFDQATNTPAVDTSAGIDAVVHFSPTLPATRTAAWTTPSVLTLTIGTVDSSVTVTSPSYPTIGLLTAHIVSSTLTNAAGTSVPNDPTSASSTVQVFGDWGHNATSRFDQSASVYNQSTLLLQDSTVPTLVTVAYNAARLATFDSTSVLVTVNSSHTQLAHLNSPVKNFGPGFSYTTVFSRLLNATGDGGLSNISILPNAGYVGADAIVISLTILPSGPTDLVTIPLVIQKANHAPTVTATSGGSIVYNAGLVFTLSGISMSDVDESVSDATSPSTPALVTIADYKSISAWFKCSQSYPSGIVSGPAIGSTVATLSLYGSLQAINVYIAAGYVTTFDPTLRGDEVSVKQFTITVNDNNNGAGVNGAITVLSTQDVPVSCVNSPAPTLQSAQLSNALDAIVLTFSAALTVRAGSTSTCASWFDAATTASFGSAPQCKISGTNLIVVSLSYDYTITVGAIVALDPAQTAVSRCQTVSKFATGSMSLQAPAAASTPIVSLAGLTSLSSCDDLNLYATVASSFGPLQYRWSVNATNILPTTLTPTSSSVAVSGSIISPGFYLFTVTVVNAAGINSAPLSLLVTKSAYPIPTLLALGGSTLLTNVPIGTDLILNVRGSIPSCLSAGVDASPSLAFTWSSSFSSSSSSFLTVPANSMAGGSTYFFTATVYVVGHTDLSNQLTFTVKTLSSPLQVAFAQGAGSNRVVGNGADLTIQALPIDPDSTADQFHLPMVL